MIRVMDILNIPETTEPVEIDKWWAGGLFFRDWTVCGCGLDARLFRGSREIGEVQGASGCGDRSLGRSTAQQSAKKLGMGGNWLVNLFGVLCLRQTGRNG